MSWELLVGLFNLIRMKCIVVSDPQRKDVYNNNLQLYPKYSESFFFLAALVILLERKKIRKKFPNEDFSKHYHAQNFSVVSDSIYFSSAIQ